MATTPHLPPRVSGRVGAFAVALGIGAAIAHHPGVAAADDTTTSSPSSSASASNTGPTRAASNTRSTRAAERAERRRERAERNSEARADVPLRIRDRSPNDGRKPPADPDPTPAVWAMAGAARRELGTDTTSAAARDTITATADMDNTVSVTAASPLGTQQQLEAEKVAAETVGTFPVKLMKRARSGVAKHR